MPRQHSSTTSTSPSSTGIDVPPAILAAAFALGVGYVAYTHLRKQGPTGPQYSNVTKLGIRITQTTLQRARAGVEAKERPRLALLPRRKEAGALLREVDLCL